MIKGEDVYHILASITPLYVALVLGYGSIKWWKIFTPNQCDGIHRYVSFFALPTLTFISIYTFNPYNMNWRLIVADTLQKIVTIIVLILWSNFTKRGGLDWSITIFSVINLPNTLVVGVPLLNAMYGEFTKQLLIQILVMQWILWYNASLLMYEYREAKIFISQQYVIETNERSNKVDSNSNVDLEMGENGSNFRVWSHSREEVYLSDKNSPQNDRSTVNFEDNILNKHSQRFKKSKSCSYMSVTVSPYPNPNSFYSRSINEGQRNINFNLGLGLTRENEEAKDVHELTSNSKVSGDKEHEGEERQMEVVDIKERSVNNEHQNISPSKVMMTKLILVRMYKKLSKNINIYAAVLGILFALILSRWNIKMPSIINDSITIISDGGLGLSMFSLGIFIASQPKIISCGKGATTMSLVLKFLVSPILFGATSAAVGIRGEVFKIGIIQAALPQGIVPFVYARMYNIHAEIFSTAIIFGMAIAFPITLLYFVLLGLF